MKCLVDPITFVADYSILTKCHFNTLILFIINVISYFISIYFYIYLLARNKA